MAPRQVYPKVTMRDLASRNPSPAARAVFDRALKHAYEDQQKILEAAAKLAK